MKTEGVILLLGSRPHNLYTLNIFVESGIDVSAVVLGESSGWNYKISRILKLLKSVGFFTCFSMFLSKLLDQILFGFSNRNWYRSKYGDAEESSRNLKVVDKVCRVDNYDDDEVRSVFEDVQPKYIVVHSQLWVPKWIREYPSVALCLGGHPGDTQYHRGAHSVFWSQVDGPRKELCYSIFEIDGGVDTGEILAKGMMPKVPNETHQQTSWRLMEKIAHGQAGVVIGLLGGGEPPQRLGRGSQAESTIYGQPSLSAYLRYLYSAWRYGG